MGSTNFKKSLKDIIGSIIKDDTNVGAGIDLRNLFGPSRKPKNKIPDISFEGLYRSVETRLRSELKSEPKEEYVLWGVSNELLSIIVKFDDLNNLEPYYYRKLGVYWAQAKFQYENDKNYFDTMALATNLELENFLKSGGVKTVKIVAADPTGETCEGCKGLDGKILPLKEAIEKRLLPCRKCTFEANKIPAGWCRCRYFAEDIGFA